MKDKIFVQLKTKYKNLGFGEKAFDGVAEYLSKTITAEEQIETAIVGVENLLKSFQGDTDKVRTELAQLKTELEALKKTSPPVEPTPPVPDSNKELEELKKRLDAFERNEMRSKLISKASTLLEGKKIPKTFYTRVLDKTEFTSDEQLEQIVTEIETDFGAFRQSMIDEGLLSIEKPVFGTGSPDGISPAMQKFIEAGSEDSSNPLGAKKL